ncbi:serine/threonine-protein kinase PkaB-like [Eriocheir sinensis]|uniref:serine/threonine-protein kinase PkaB-like n=1 Tax=Eriocheir sinensis TaxID=95602 RepID=UPI0021C9F5C5|nr:serine/threonine-protein kinase PkaB-like [Eriocheir sinensis]XP_050709897.1 serine/threonine-protein kinase PkaB-like [Eriocheir sinensis]
MAPPHTTPLLVLTKERIDTLVSQHKQVLGRGASCTVYLVEVGGAQCCLKVAREQRLAAMFRREFDILLDLDGAAGAPKALGTSFGFPAMLTTFCGQNTFCDLHNLADSDTDRLEAFVALARDVQQLHACGYTHNDIKPDNVVVHQDAKGRLKVSLIDYGLAKRFGTGLRIARTHTHRTPWMAPELLRGAPCSPPVDVFSLGYVLRRVLATCHTQYPGLEVLADRAMRANPAQRPSAARIIKTVKEYTGQTSRKAAFVRRVRKAFSCLFPRRRHY